jgi:hypothetical protein
MQYIEGYLRDFESALYGPNYADPTSGWRKLANQTSAIEYFLVEVTWMQDGSPACPHLAHKKTCGWTSLSEQLVPCLLRAHSK